MRLKAPFSMIPMSNPVYAAPHEGLRGAHASGMTQIVRDVDPAAVMAAVPVHGAASVTASADLGYQPAEPV